MLNEKGIKMQFKPGFRFSLLDAFILITALCAAVFLFPYDAYYSVLVGFVVLHFFLFCNVVRMSRTPEIIWSFVFLSAFYGQLKLAALSFNLALLISLFMTVVLVIFEIRKPSYHGICWEMLNPKLPKWFAERQKRSNAK